MDEVLVAELDVVEGLAYGGRVVSRSRVRRLTAAGSALAGSESARRTGVYCVAAMRSDDWQVR
jgi:hypothetical protein